MVVAIETVREGSGSDPGLSTTAYAHGRTFFLHFLVSEFHVQLPRRALDHLRVVIFVFAPSEMGSLTNFTTTVFNLHHISFVLRSEYGFGSTIGMCE